MSRSPYPRASAVVSNSFATAVDGNGTSSPSGGFERETQVLFASC
jgi:hypothetical protein